uniref:Uncharacterized protein n=1 Tax=Anguilla anguilla TaxID=7936 RepID=A0A0E9W3Y8_ANGAN
MVENCLGTKLMLSGNLSFRVCFGGQGFNIENVLFLLLSPHCLNSSP